jgi:hypothetical protein
MTVIGRLRPRPQGARARMMLEPLPVFFAVSLIKDCSF